MSVAFSLCAVLVFLLAGACSTPWEHMLVLWEDSKFQGESSYVLIRDHSCVSLISKWRNRVSSIDTNRHCYQLYEGTNCDKKEIYVYPMSKHHDDLTDLGLNDIVNSVRYCVLDEEVVNATNAHQKEKYEHPFWDFVLGKISLSYQNAYRSLASKYKFSNPWHFIPNIRSSNPLAEQYQAALDWFIYGVSLKNLTMEDLRHARKLSYAAFDNRANVNGARKVPFTLGSHEDAVTFQLEVYWKIVVETIDNEINKRLDQLEEAKLRKNGQVGDWRR